MPRVSCPHCGVSVLAVPVGHTVTLRGGAGLEACRELGSVAGADDLLNCSRMKAAVEAALESLTEPSLSALWQADPADKRLYERWQPLIGVLQSGSKRYQCVVLDISPGGAAVWTEASAEVPEGGEVLFAPQGHDELPAEVVRLSSGVLGLMFLLEADGRIALAEWLSALRDLSPAAR